MNDLINNLTWHDLVNKLKVILNGFSSQVVINSAPNYTVAPTSAKVLITNQCTVDATFTMPPASQYKGTQITLGNVGGAYLNLKSYDGVTKNIFWGGSYTANPTFGSSTIASIYSDGNNWIAVSSGN